MGRKYGFSFSWKRALGVSAAKGRISRKIGIPLTKSGRRQKVGRMAGCCLPVIAAIGLLAATACLAHPGRTDANGGHHDRKTGGYHYHGGSSGGRSTGESGSGFTTTPEPNVAPQPGQFGGYTPTPHVRRGPAKAAGGWTESETGKTASELLETAPITSILMVKVVGVTDGDTITGLSAQDEQIKIRLYGVDAPESHQAFGTKAKQFVSDACFGQKVKASITENDRFGRQVAWITLPDGKILNEALVAAGMAHWYEKYAPHDIQLKVLQEKAQASKVGLWSDPNPIAPWDFRREGGQSAESVPSLSAERAVVNPQAGSQQAIQEGEVFVTRTGLKYHREGCRVLSKSKLSISLSDAKTRYDECSICRPPQ